MLHAAKKNCTIDKNDAITVHNNMACDMYMILCSGIVHWQEGIHLSWGDTKGMLLNNCYK